jgi:hypothetical protein
MSHGKLREDTACQNCGDEVKLRFCPTCGQENTETKKSFHYLFTHFLEDLVHYESSFWKALKYLLYAPEKLSLTYLSGKRKAFMAPVRLFIFINIFSFIIFSSFTFKEIENEINSEIANDNFEDESHSKSDNKLTQNEKVKDNKTIKINLKNNNFFKIKFEKTREKYTEDQILQKVTHKFFQNSPKFLFLVMPFFALTLWLTHNKKKWWYFDHGIFTFHYFSSFLLILSIATLINQVLGIFNYETNDIFTYTIFLYLNVLFIKAFVFFYKEPVFKNILKLLVIYFLNLLILFITFGLFYLYILLTI